jgi:hypothetical protein
VPIFIDRGAPLKIPTYQQLVQNESWRPSVSITKAGEQMASTLRQNFNMVAQLCTWKIGDERIAAN